MVNKLNVLQSLEALNQALAESVVRPVLLFKHSLTCPISQEAFHEVQGYLENADPAVSAHLITVQTDRAISNEIVVRLGITHETPQVILVHNGGSIWSASHFDITAATLEEAVNSLARN